MSKRSPASLEVKLHVVRLCLEHKSNPNYEAKQLGVSTHTIKEWIRKYKADGLDGLKESRTWKTYSKELKLAAINDVLSGHTSVEEATKKHHISSRSVLIKWISKYTNEIELKPTHKGKGISHMNKGRKTTFEERIEIAQYTIAMDWIIRRRLKNMVYLISKFTHGFGNIKLAVKRLFRTIAVAKSLQKN